MKADPAYWPGKVVWVTGSSSGIGKALAISLADRGADPVLSGRQEGALEELAAVLSTRSLILPFDVTEHDQLDHVVAQAWDWRDGVDLIINNAGISQLSLAQDTAFDVYRRIMAVDFFAAVHLTQLLLPHMISRGHGHLAAVSSTLGKVRKPFALGLCGGDTRLDGLLRFTAR